MIGLGLSTGIQYLEKEKMKQAWNSLMITKQIPYSMKLVIQFLLLRALTDELLHFDELIFLTTFKASRVMEYKSWAVGKDHLIIDLVNSSLSSDRQLNVQEIKE